MVYHREYHVLGDNPPRIQMNVVLYKDDDTPSHHCYWDHMDRVMAACSEKLAFSVRVVAETDAPLELAELRVFGTPYSVPPLPQPPSPPNTVHLAVDLDLQSVHYLGFDRAPPPDQL